MNVSVDVSADDLKFELTGHAKTSGRSVNGWQVKSSNDLFCYLTSGQCREIATHFARLAYEIDRAEIARKAVAS